MTAKASYFKSKKAVNENKRISMIAWNVAGLCNKDSKFWKEINKHDIIGLTETWMERTSKKVEECWSKDHKWTMIKAEREAKKGRAKGGILIGIRKEWNAEVETKSKDMVEIRCI